jgi:hypothetical protein
LLPFGKRDKTHSVPEKAAMLLDGLMGQAPRTVGILLVANEADSNNQDKLERI